MNKIVAVFLMLASTTQFKFGNKYETEYVINLVSIFLIELSPLAILHIHSPNYYLLTELM